jgi:predicted ABC-type ATPase
LSKEVIIIAGANGAGKTTFARKLETRYPYKFINADEIAGSINPQDINQAKLEAGKLFFRHIRQAMEAGESQ